MCHVMMGDDGSDGAVTTGICCNFLKRNRVIICGTVLSSESMDATPYHPFICMHRGRDEWSMINKSQSTPTHYMLSSHYTLPTYTHTAIQGKMKKSTPYENPWPSYTKPSFIHLLSHLLDHTPPPLGSLPKEPNLPVVHVPNFESRVSEPRVMWLGHASCYLQLPTPGGNYGILFDPIFSNRCVFFRIIC